MAELTNDQVIHNLKNHLAIIVGFCDLLIADAADGDPRKADLLEVNQAAREAMAAIPEIARRLRLAAFEAEK
jgi:hypothetical protein